MLMSPHDALVLGPPVDSPEHRKEYRASLLRHLESTRERVSEGIDMGNLEGFFSDFQSAIDLLSDDDGKR
jgi:hypothetical protein